MPEHAAIIDVSRYYPAPGKREELLAAMQTLASSASSRPGCFGAQACESDQEGEGFALAPDPLAGDVEVDGHRLTWHPEQVRFVEQAHDFSCGELRTVLEFRPRDVAARIQVLVFCSRSLPTLVLGEVAVEVDGECELTVKAAVDPGRIRGSLASRRTMTPGTDEQVVDGF